MRIAYFTPLSPQHSGITDHSEELLPYLAPYADIDIVISGVYAPDNKEICDRFRIITCRDYLNDPDAYDAAVYQIGNNLRFHAYMIPCMRAAPGIVVLQDYSLQYLVLGLTLRHGEVGTLEDVLHPVYKEHTRSLVRKLILGMEDPAELTFAFPFLAASRGVIVHSQHALDLVQPQVPDKQVRNVPMGIIMPSFTESVAELRKKHGYHNDDFIIASVSTRAPKKRLEVVLEAIHLVKERIPKLKLLVVGGGSPGDKIYRLINEYGLNNIVEQTGWVDAQRYQDLIHLSDIGIDLRDMAAAETAHSALRCIASGVPIIVSASGTFLELPDSCCPKLVADEHQATYLAELLVEYRNQPQQLQTMKKAAIDYAGDRLSLELQGREFMAFVKELVESTPGSGEVALLEPHPGHAKRFYAILYKICRVIFLLRRYGISDSWRRLRINLASKLNPQKPETM
jgi:glycosyltransferase involved in cell wall biosynthesis